MGVSHNQQCIICAADHTSPNGEHNRLETALPQTVQTPEKKIFPADTKFELLEEQNLVQCVWRNFGGVKTKNKQAKHYKRDNAELWA